MFHYVAIAIRLLTSWLVVTASSCNHHIPDSSHPPPTHTWMYMFTHSYAHTQLPSDVHIACLPRCLVVCAYLCACPCIHNTVMKTHPHVFNRLSACFQQTQCTCIHVYFPLIPSCFSLPSLFPFLLSPPLCSPAPHHTHS